MSGLDQPIVIANSCYHVGHERSVRIADQQGFFKEEGLDRYVYQSGGLVPGKWEHEGLGQQMWERGVDIATAVDARAAITQRARGEDVYIVGGWRTQLETRLIGARGITRPEQLRGVKASGSGGRDSLGLLGVSGALRRLGVDPVRDIEWIARPPNRYEDEPTSGDPLRSGHVSAIAMSGREKEAERLVSEGYPLILDTEEFFKEFYQGLGAWPPSKVVVATKRTIEERGEELRAFLRGNVRAYWFIQDPRNHRVVYELETRMRQNTFNEYERKVRMLKAETPPPPGTGLRTMGFMVMDGLVPRVAVGDIVAELQKYEAVDPSLGVDDVLKDAASIEACDQLLSRGVISRPALDEWRAINS